MVSLGLDGQSLSLLNFLSQGGSSGSLGNKAKDRLCEAAERT